MSTSGDPVLQPLFVDEGGYCHLLRLFLTTPEEPGVEFRQALAPLLQEKLGVSIGPDPLSVRREVKVTPPEAKDQWIDLVMDLQEDVIGFEVKVSAAAAQKGQLAAQYAGLRDVTAASRRVHSLFLFPGKTEKHLEVVLTGDSDRAASISWSEVIACLPQSAVSDPARLLREVASQARLAFEMLPKRKRVTIVTPERDQIHRVMKESVGLVSRRLRELDPGFKACRWHTVPWRDPRMDQLYGPVERSDGTRLKGQYLEVNAYYHDLEECGDNPPVGVTEIPMSVGFVLEVAGGFKVYRQEFDKALPACLEELPESLGERKRDQGERRVVDHFTVVKSGDAWNVQGRPATEAISELISGYARAFRMFLLRQART